MKKTITMIGNAHLDPVWLWPWQEGYQEVKATFQSALDRMEENADFVFTCACADYYRWVEENDPAMFEKIRARVREGRWAIVGGMWIQPDMNTPSGECLVRQLLYSQRYFREKFGVTVTTGYNVDTFGHNGMTPQLLRRAGIQSYVWMRPGMHENACIPEGTMIWEGLDGSRVQAFRIPDAYGTARDEDAKIDRTFEWAARIGQKVMCFYGVGNHGGGPTRKSLAIIDAYRKNAPRGGEVVYGSPDDFFSDMDASGQKLPVWRGELQHHASGCYSTHAKSKMLHRQADNAMARMEKLGVLSRVLTGHGLRAAFVQQGWHNLMFNEFHDIMGGCSLPEALEDACVQLSETLSIAAREENAAVQRLTWQVDTIKGHPQRVRSKESDWSLWGVAGQGTPVVVLNPHGFEAEGDVLVRRPVRRVKDDGGNDVPVQTVRATRTNGADKWDAIFRARVPAMGYRLYWIFLEGEEQTENELSVSDTVLENAKLRAEFDAHTGALLHLIIKETGRDALSAPARVRLMDIEHCDTWAHGIFRFDQPAGVFSGAQIDVIERGPVRAGLRVTTRFGASELVQEYYLYAKADQLHVDARLNMQEKHRMVKLCFPTDGAHDVAEIPYGVIERAGNGEEESCQRWVAVQGEKGGLAVLNNGRYSYSAPDGELRMTVANTSIYADHYGQTERDASCRYMDQGELAFSYEIVPYMGAWQDARLSRRAALLNQTLVHVVETYHEGPLGGEYRGLSIDVPNVDVGAFKRAEDGNGYILRVCETVGRPVRTHIDIPLLARKLEVELGAFEIRTLYVTDDAAQRVRAVLLTELEENEKSGPAR